MNITSDEGLIVSWGGEVTGPNLVYSPMGTPLTVSLYTAEISVEGEAELREIGFFVTELARKEIEMRASSNHEELVRQSVSRYLVRQVENRWIPGNDEYFSIPSEELISISNELRNPGAAN